MDNKSMVVSIGASRKETNWKQQTLTVSELFDRLEKPTRTTETMSAYLGMKKVQQDDLKDVGGFVGGTLNGPRRKSDSVTGRTLVTLDFDTIPSGATDKMKSAVEALGCCYCLYSTRKHAANAPRLRVVLPSDRVMTPDEYEPCARYLAAQIGIEMADPTTFELARLMYWPSCCADSEFVYSRNDDAPCFSVDSILQQYTDWHDVTQWARVPGEDKVHKSGSKQADPESKKGVVGAFCRTYDVYRAINELLPGVYEEVENAPDRYTYTGGSTTGGAVVYDSGKFLFSHHATDPCSGLEVNAFDLVRLHKFGKQDDEARPDTPVNRLPSFTAMTEFALSLPSVIDLMDKERHDSAVEDFGGIAATDGEQENWMRRIDRDGNGLPKPTTFNYKLYLSFDPKLKGRLMNDCFADRTLGIAPLPWGSRETMPEGDQFIWSDSDDAGLRVYIEQVTKSCHKSKLEDALVDHLAKHTINPVKDYLTSLKWDGTHRLDTLFIDYLGAEDSGYTRAVTRKAFTAAVARVMTPGCKFDNMLILCGPQGVGKSTILDKMARDHERFNDSIRTFEGKEASELIQGIWIVEIAELDAFRKSDVARIKQFLSLRADQYRKAFGHRRNDHPRTCVFFGTCNNADFLQDTTGNRRFWPVDVCINKPTKSIWKDLDGEIDQLWAEAYVRWQMGEALFLTGEIEEQAKAKQEEHREVNPLEGEIAEFIDKPIPSDWNRWTLDRRLDYWAGYAKGEYTLVQRNRVTVIEIWCEMLRKNKAELLNDKRNAASIRAVLDKLGWKRLNSYRCPPYGKQNAFERPILLGSCDHNP